MSYKGNWLHAQPSVNISLFPMAKRIYSLRAETEYITVTCKPCRIKGCMHESENQSPDTAATAPLIASRTSASQVRNWVHLAASLFTLQCGSVGNSTHALLVYAGWQTAIFARTPHKEPCGMQSLLVPTQTACLCSIITLELVAINPSS